MYIRPVNVFRLCLFTVLVACFLCASYGAPKTARKYAHGKLAGSDILKNHNTNLRETINNKKLTNRHLQGITDTDKMPWYVPADEARFDDVGKLWIQDFTVEPAVTSHCTAFYVGDDILVTAAHCLTGMGITSVKAATNKYAILFYQGYQGVDIKTDNEAKKFGRFVVEYWYPADYEEGPCVAIAGSGHDWAFLRVDAKKSTSGMYSLVESEAFLYETVLGVGYPADAADEYKPVYAQGKLYKPTDTEFKEDKGSVRQGRTEAQLTDVAKTQLAIIATKLPDGKMGRWIKEGASGGPMFLSPESLSKSSNSGKERSVVGMIFWSLQPLKQRTIRQEQPYMQSGISPIITKDMLEIQTLLREKKYELITVDEEASKIVPSQRCKKTKK